MVVCKLRQAVEACFKLIHIFKFHLHGIDQSLKIFGNRQLKSGIQFKCFDMLLGLVLGCCDRRKTSLGKKRLELLSKGTHIPVLIALLTSQGTFLNEG